MSKFKIPKKSTNIDMTAMCDVAFLLLTFFMLATKFKPEDPVEIKTPASVSSKAVPDKDVMLILFDKEGRIFFQMDNPNEKLKTIRLLNDSKGLGLSAEQMNVFVNEASMGVPFNQLASYLSLDREDAKRVVQPGIPADSLNNELLWWVDAAIRSYIGKTLNILLKGDNAATYETFKRVVNVLKKQDQFQFNLITSVEDVPEGTALYATRNSRTPVQNNEK